MNQNNMDEYELFNLGKRYYDAKNYTNAAHYFVQAYRLGHPEATFYTGVCCFKGAGVERNYKTAAALFRKASEMGVQKATYNLALCYENGYGVEKDLDKAYSYYINAAFHGIKPAKNQLRKMPAPVTPKSLTRQEQEMWDKYANNALNTFKKSNNDSPCKMTQDKELAFKMLERGIAAGHVRSMYYLGHVYQSYDDIGFYSEEKTTTKKYELLSKAARLGSRDALRDISQYYLEGLVVEKDVNEAIRILNKAIELGDTDAYGILGCIYEDEAGIYGKKDQKKAFECYYKGAQHGVTRCEYNLGFCYEEGLGIPHNAKKALFWYKKAADKNYTGAKCAYDLCREMYRDELY